MALERVYSDDAVELLCGDCRKLDLPERPELIIVDPPWGETKHAWDTRLREIPALCASWQGEAGAVAHIGSMRLHGDTWQDWKAAGYKFAWDLIIEWPNGSGFETDRPKRVHEIVAWWYRGEWSDQQHAVPKVKGQYHKVTPSSSSTRQKGRIDQIHYEGDDRLLRSVRPVRLADEEILKRVRTANPAKVAECQKPAALFADLVHYGCPPGGMVLDPCCGAGGSLVAARRLGRRAIGVELRREVCERSLVYRPDPVIVPPVESSQPKQLLLEEGTP